MPIARFEMPDGRIARFEVPEGTTPEQAQAQMQSMIAGGLGEPQAPTQAEAPQETGFIDEATAQAEKFAKRQLGGLEAAAAIGSGIVAEPIAGIAGLVGSALPGEPGQGARTVEATREALTFQPRTEGGQQIVEGIGEAVQTGVDLARVPISGLAGLGELATGQGLEQAVGTVEGVQDQGVGKQLGQRALEVTGSPIVASAVETAPTAVLSTLGFGPAVKTTNNLVRLAKNKKLFGGQSAFKEKIAADIAAGSTDKRLAKFMVDGSGKVRPDKIAKEAIKQGFDEGVIATVKGSSGADRAKMLKMTNIAKKGKENALFAAKNRPSDIAGNSLLERINHVKKVNIEAGKRINTEASKLKGKPVDLTEATTGFSNALDEFGVRLVGNGKGGIRPDFELSVFAPGDRGPLKEIVRQMSIASRKGEIDGLTAHKMKRIIDNNVTYGKNKTGISGDAERMLKDFRRNIDTSLDNTFPSYNSANSIYSDTVGALDSFQDVAGRKIDLFGPNANKATGTVLRGMMSNIKSRVNLVDSVDNLEAIARKHGGKFNDDITTQMLFADELDSMFGAAAKTSLQGEVAKAVKSGGRAAQGRTVADVSIDAAAAAAEKLRNINQDAAFKSMQELLK